MEYCAAKKSNGDPAEEERHICDSQAEPAEIVKGADGGCGGEEPDTEASVEEERRDTEGGYAFGSEELGWQEGAAGDAGFDVDCACEKNGAEEEGNEDLGGFPGRGTRC